MSVDNDPKTFRRVLGHYPTGVCAITAVQGGSAVPLIREAIVTRGDDRTLVN